MALVGALGLLTLSSYPKPRLTAQPAAVVTPGINVTLRCHAPRPAWRFAFFRLGESVYVSSDLDEFFLEEVTLAQGGAYTCRYGLPDRGPSVWSQPSDVLELLVAEQLPRPSLVALPGPVVAPGATVSLRCAARVPGMSFALYRAGEADPVQYRDSAEPWADFPLAGAHAPGTYSCYYHTPHRPYVLSLRSEPLEVRAHADLHPPDYTFGNLVRLGLAGLVLAALCTLVTLHCRNARRALGQRPPGSWV
ncbi:osteoclast-associated immunoglobulin-like receptor isoform X2 [Ochotona curzoniae]|uniref:osteoclast-associated immunoglobulin-like receptor isoform X2 n=1 Tax=Ochotona curzoniae TaxID=130825 RepID=UPI001B349A30|nr:osteoclast-associated immunoglobulin-like receptor isoform X2 [Ochotona curzoniae]XP_040852326.1 osteoclast-associated immunoglobulin-like receptor isoform X2 [Ochotona curzoniae]